MFYFFTITINEGGHQYLDYINVMAYDYYWTGYEFTMDLEALNNLGITNVIISGPFFLWLPRVVNMRTIKL